MGHRALVARERPGDGGAGDGDDEPRYDLYYSHWGGADLSLARDLGAAGTAEPWTHPQVDPDPLATGVGWAELLGSHLDPLVHEALFVLPRAGDPRAYRPFWPGRLDCPHAVVAVDPGKPGDDAFVRELLDGAREALLTAFEAGHLDADEAGTVLRRAVDDCFGGREVVWLDG